jgi:pyruvate kinase
MVDSPRPTRTEAADVANAVLDGSDAVMLSEESAIGAYPVEAVRILTRITETAEKRFLAQERFTIFSAPGSMSTSTAIGYAACVLAREASAAAIVCCTRTGRTARLVAKNRPAPPIIAVSPHHTTVRRLSLTWGVRAVYAEEFDTTHAMVHAAVEAARGTGLLAPGAKIVLVGAAPSTPLGHTDFLRVVTVS